MQNYNSIQKFLHQILLGYDFSKKSLYELEKISIKQTHLPVKDVELSIKHILTLMSDTLSKGDRIEIRGFGSFSLHYRPSRIGRNPEK